VSDLLVRLLTVLDAEHALCLRLCDLLRTERSALEALDVPRLEQLVREKEELADEGRLLEESRIVVTEAFARQLRIPEPRPRLSRVCEALGDAAPRLRDAHRRLAAVLALARELVEANSAATLSELANVQASLRALGAAPGGESYGPPSRPPEAGRLVRQAV
jgi:hypothetical protein